MEPIDLHMKWVFCLFFCIILCFGTFCLSVSGSPNLLSVPPFLRIVLMPATALDAVDAFPTMYATVLTSSSSEYYGSIPLFYISFY